MAEGLARHLWGDAVRVQSAGSSPSRVHPLAIEALGELGITADGHASTSVEDVDPATVDTVITLCAEEVCPAFLGDARRLHWPIDDPAPPGAPASIEGFRTARDRIAAKLRALEVN